MPCRQHGPCRVGNMAPTCRCVGQFGGKKSPTRRRHYQPSQRLAEIMGLYPRSREIVIYLKKLKHFGRPKRLTKLVPLIRQQLLLNLLACWLLVLEIVCTYDMYLVP
jgi:hypothetical protein